MASGLMEAYKNLITSQHRGKPNYMATLTALLKYSEDIFACTVYMDDYFDLDIAGGEQEDVLGVIVGAERNLPFQPQTQVSAILNNEDYRTFLKAKIAKNLWKGGINDIADIWETLFGERIKIIDNQDMTVEVVIENVPSSVVQEMIARGMIVPKPQSVGINYHFVRDLDSALYFGGAMGMHWRTEVFQPAPGDASMDSTLYFGGIFSSHRKFVVDPMRVEDATAESTLYHAGRISYHKKFKV